MIAMKVKKGKKEKIKNIKIKVTVEGKKVKAGAEVEVEVGVKKEIEKVEVEVKVEKRIEVVLKALIIKVEKMKKMREITIQIVNITGKMIKTKIIEDIKIEMRENTMTMIEEGLLIEEIIC